MNKFFLTVFFLFIAVSVANPPFCHGSADSREVNLTVEKAFSRVDSVMVAMGLVVEQKRPTQGSALVIANGKKSRGVEQHFAGPRGSKTPTHLVLNFKSGFAYTLTASILYLQKDKSKVTLAVKILDEEDPLTATEKIEEERKLQKSFWEKFDVSVRQ
jgi:hypothetical protein